MNHFQESEAESEYQTYVQTRTLVSSLGRIIIDKVYRSRHFVLASVIQLPIKLNYYAQFSTFSLSKKVKTQTTKLEKLHLLDNKPCNNDQNHLFDFLFAAQDASTSALLWALVLLDSHQNVLEKVREEVAKFWSSESDQPLTADMLREMKYLEAVAREIIRIRAPATMVPHIAGEEFRLTEDYVIPKGTIVFPSVFDSSFQGFTEPEKFDPDRFMEERQEDRVYKKNFLAFGAGPHACVGQKYAINHLMLFIAMFTALIDFKRHKTNGCDDISYIPTIAPKDDCKVFLSQRCTRFPSL